MQTVRTVQALYYYLLCTAATRLYQIWCVFCLVLSLDCAYSGYGRTSRSAIVQSQKKIKKNKKLHDHLLSRLYKTTWLYFCCSSGIYAYQSDDYIVASICFWNISLWKSMTRSVWPWRYVPKKHIVATIYSQLINILFDNGKNIIKSWIWLKITFMK